MVELLEAVRREEKGKNDWKGREFTGRYEFGHRTCRDCQSVPAKLRENLDCFRSHSIRSLETFRSLQEFNTKKKKKNNHFLYSYNNFQKIIIFEIIRKWF